MRITEIRPCVLSPSVVPAKAIPLITTLMIIRSHIIHIHAPFNQTRQKKNTIDKSWCCGLLRDAPLSCSRLILYLVPYGLTYRHAIFTHKYYTTIHPFFFFFLKINACASTIKKPFKVMYHHVPVCTSPYHSALTAYCILIYKRSD